MPDNIISLAEQNLITVSGQRNAVLRGNAVARLWIAEGVFVDAEGYTTDGEILRERPALYSHVPRV